MTRSSTVALRNEIHAFRTAIAFFTRIPAAGGVPWSEQMAAASMAYAPITGVIVGVVTAATAWASLKVSGGLVAAVLATAVGALLTGALHEDGLADTCDGLFGGQSRDRALEIMKDSRIGSFGALGLCLVTFAKVSMLAQAFDGRSGLRVSCSVLVLVVGHSVSRTAAIAQMRLLRYVRTGQSKSRPMAAPMSGSRLVFALMVSALIIGALVAPRRIPILVGVTALTTVGMAVWFRRRLGGYTGDCLGAVQQVTELVLFGVLTARLGS